MLHPNQFQVNEAWIIFKLNDAPIPSTLFVGDPRESFKARFSGGSTQ